MRLSAAALPAAQFRQRKIGLDAAVVGLGVNTCGEGAGQGKVDAAVMRVEVEMASLGGGHLDMDAAVMGGAAVEAPASTLALACVWLCAQPLMLTPPLWPALIVIRPSTGNGRSKSCRIWPVPGCDCSRSSIVCQDCRIFVSPQSSNVLFCKASEKCVLVWACR